MDYFETSENAKEPSNLEAERALLGAIILDAERALPMVLPTHITPADFFKKSHGQIFEIICRLYDKNEPVDLVTLAEAVNAEGLLAKIGGAAYLSELSDSVAVAANAARYAQIVIDRAILRRLISIAASLTEECLGSPKAVDEVIDRAESAIYKVRESRNSQNMRAVSELLPEAFNEINRLSARGDGLTGIPTGYSDLDSIIGGFQRSDLVILGARPRMGKTSLALNLALNAAIPQQRQKYRDLPAEAVAVFSLEMSKEQLIQRLICQSGQLDLRDLRTGRLKPEHIQQLTGAISILEKAKIYIDDSSALRILELRSKARRLKSQLDIQGRPLGLIVVDYLQLMRGSQRADNREQEISEISRGLKSLAKELNVPVLALSQLNRSVEDYRRKSKKPVLSDLRESGAIEQDADLIAFVHRQEEFETEETEKEKVRGQAELLIQKHRNGPTGVVKLFFKKEYSYFFPVELF